MSEILEFVFNNEEKTVVKVPNTTKINMSVDGEFQLIEFIPEVEVYKPKFKRNQFVVNLTSNLLYRIENPCKANDENKRLATPEEIDVYLKQKNQMLDDNGNIVDWKPKIGEKYYVCNLTTEYFYHIIIFDGDLTDTRRFSRKIAFPTKEQAIEKTKEFLNIK